MHDPFVRLNPYEHLTHVLNYLHCLQAIGHILHLDNTLFDVLTG